MEQEILILPIISKALFFLDKRQIFPYTRFQALLK